MASDDADDFGLDPGLEDGAAPELGDSGGKEGDEEVLVDGGDGGLRDGGDEEEYDDAVKDDQDLMLPVMDEERGEWEEDEAREQGHGGLVPAGLPSQRYGDEEDEEDKGIEKEAIEASGGAVRSDLWALREQLRLGIEAHGELIELLESQVGDGTRGEDGQHFQEEEEEEDDMAHEDGEQEEGGRGSRGPLDESRSMPTPSMCKRADELEGWQLRETVVAVKECTEGGGAGVLGIIRHPHGVKLLDSMLLAMTRSHGNAERACCTDAVDALGNIASCKEGRAWLCGDVVRCRAAVEHLREHIWDKQEGWAVSDLASSASLALSNLLCAKAVLDIALDIDEKIAAEAGLSSGGEGGGVEGGKGGPREDKEEEKDGGVKGVVGGLAALLGQAPSNASINAATALGNVCRRSRGRKAVVSSPLFPDIAEELCEMVDETHDESAREALTALCNICDSPEGRAALSTELRTLKTLASGLSNRMSPWKVLEGMGGGPESEAQRESLCDAAGIVQSLGSRGGSGIFLTEGGGVAAGLGCMMECGEGDVFSSALAACDSLAAEISNRHRLVDGMHAGAVLAKLRVHFTAEDVDAEERELAMRLAVRLIDGVGRELSLAEHPDGSVLARMLVICCKPIERGSPELARSLTSTALATIGRVCMSTACLDFFVEQIEAPRLIEALACAVERGGPELETATFAAYTTLESAKVGDALAASPKFPRLLQIITEGLAGRGGGREGGLAEGSDEAAGALKALLSSGDASVRLEKEGLASDLAGKLVAMVASAEESSMAASTLNQLIERCPSALGSMGEIIDQLISCMSRGMQPPLRGGKPLSSEGAESIFSRLGKADSAHIAGRLISEVAAARPLLTAPAPRGPMLSGVLVTLLKGKSGEDASFALGQLWDKCCAPSCCASSCYTPSGEDGAAAANELCNVMGPGGRTSSWAPILALSHMCVRTEARHAVSKRLPDVADRARIVRRLAQARMPQQPLHGAPGHAVKIRRDSIVGSSLEALAGLDSNQLGFGLTIEWTQAESGGEGGDGRGGVPVHGGGKRGERRHWFLQLCEAIGNGGFELANKEGADLLLGCMVALSLLYHDCPPTLVSPLIPATAWGSLLQGGAGSFRDGVFKVVSPNVVQLLSRGELEGGVLGLPWDEGSNFDVMD